MKQKLKKRKLTQKTRKERAVMFSKLSLLFNGIGTPKRPPMDLRGAEEINAYLFLSITIKNIDHTKAKAKTKE